MIDDRYDPNRPRDPYDEPGGDLAGSRASSDDRTGWGIFALIAIVVLVIGGLFWYGAAQQRSARTASYQPAAELQAPATPSATDPAVRPNQPATK